MIKVAICDDDMQFIYKLEQSIFRFAEMKRIKVDVQIEYIEDYTWDDIKETFTENLAEYLKNVIKNEWEAKDTMTLRSGQIESMLLDMEGVDNVLSVKIDGKTGNCIIVCDYIPKVGEISG